MLWNDSGKTSVNECLGRVSRVQAMHIAQESIVVAALARFISQIHVDCAIVYCIGRIFLLDMKCLLAKKSQLFQFEIAFSDIWIFLTPKGC